MPKISKQVLTCSAHGRGIITPTHTQEERVLGPRWVTPKESQILYIC